MQLASARDHASKLARPLPVTPNVFIVDDDISVRESLESLIRFAGWQPETFASAEEFLAHPRAIVPCCLVLDYRLPRLDGLDLQKLVAADVLCMPIIFITCHCDAPMAVQAMKAGALDILIKPFADDALLYAVQQGIARSHAALRRQGELRRLRHLYTGLSLRERQVMSLVVAGRLNKQIGSELKVSEVTVKAHRGRVMRKMQAGSLAELVNMSIKLDAESLPESLS
jgi:FixJ family two-component response regulator